MNFSLINSINEQVEHQQDMDNMHLFLTEKFDDVEILCEEAKTILGKAIARLNAGKHPWEQEPGLKELVAGLMLIAKYREALNISDKQFSQIKDMKAANNKLKDQIRKIATNHGKSLIQQLEDQLTTKQGREKLIRRLRDAQADYVEQQTRVGLDADSHKATKLG